MKISGFIRTSLIDYPGKIASVIFTQGCNFHCPYCHNAELVPLFTPNDEYFSESYIFSELEKRVGFIDGVVITGGEPFLQEDILNFVREVKRRYPLLVKIDTNGSFPDLLDLFIKEGLVDYIAMDVKDSFINYHKYTKHRVSVYDIVKSINIIKTSGVDYEFRTTVLPAIHSKFIINSIAFSLVGAKRLVLQNFKPNNTLDPHFMKEQGFSDEELEKFKIMAEKFVKEVYIRN